MSKTYTKVEKDFIYHYKDPEMTILHREDGPAIEHKKGFEESWYLDGVPHRDGGPAVIIKKRKGVEEYSSWYKDGLQHRDDGPAEITEMFERYYKDGFLHREDGPAIIDRNEENASRWFLNDQEYMKLNESEIVEFNGVKFIKCPDGY